MVGWMGHTVSFRLTVGVNHTSRKVAWLTYISLLLPVYLGTCVYVCMYVGRYVSTHVYARVFSVVFFKFHLTLMPRK